MDYFDIDFYELLKNIDENIKQNQNDELTLEEMAKQYYISKYYFHRLFHSATGESFAKFIKQRRLLFASNEIVSTDKDLIDIAYDYGFNSQDVFIRAFKQMFGYTPGYFRKLYQNIIFIKKDKLEFKGGNIMFDIFLGQRLQFSDNDKRECLETAAIIIELSQLTRNAGILALETKINSLDSLFFKKAVTFLVDGCSEGEIREILQNYIIYSNYKGKDLLQRILIMEGIVSLSNGHNPQMIYERLASYFGESFFFEYEKYFEMRESPVNIQATIDSFREKLKSAGFSPNTNLLEEHFKEFKNDQPIQRLIREISPQVLLLAMCGSSDFVITKLIANMSQRSAAMIANSYNYREEGRNYSDDEIIKAQNKILATLFELKAKGEIPAQQKRLNEAEIDILLRGEN